MHSDNFFSPESVMHKVKFSCRDEILSKKMQGREECVIAR